MTGTVFDIKEFAVNDGEGIRTSVFLKGCPLRCAWCHNPEGLSPAPELYEKQNGCLHCGLCRRPCSHPDCRPYGRCLHVCPKNLLSVKGEIFESGALADKLLKNCEFYSMMGGGVTFTGGEPLLQHEFFTEVVARVKGKIHIAIETSGYADPEVFSKAASLCDFVYMDIKLIDREAHRKYTGVYNDKIAVNAGWLKQSGIAHCFRTPLVPGITDTEENLSAIAALVGESDWEKLPYNSLAPAKYACVGRKFGLDC